MAKGFIIGAIRVATVPTACGIETNVFKYFLILANVATVPTACGIETCYNQVLLRISRIVATVPTACGIETCYLHRGCWGSCSSCNSAYRLRY